MNRQAATSATEAPDDREAGMLDETQAVSTMLEDVATPVQSTEVTLTSGRRYALEAGDATDRLTIRSRSGSVVLTIEVSDRGPVLSFAAADIDITAERRLRLAAERVEVEAAGDMTMAAGGSITARAAGHHHVTSGASARLEAPAVTDTSLSLNIPRGPDLPFARRRRRRAR